MAGNIFSSSHFVIVIIVMFCRIEGDLLIPLDFELLSNWGLSVELVIECTKGINKQLQMLLRFTHSLVCIKCRVNENKTTIQHIFNHQSSNTDSHSQSPTATLTCITNIIRYNGMDWFGIFWWEFVVTISGQVRSWFLYFNFRKYQLQITTDGTGFGKEIL